MERDCWAWSAVLVPTLQPAGDDPPPVSWRRRHRVHQPQPRWCSLSVVAGVDRVSENPAHAWPLHVSAVAGIGDPGQSPQPVIAAIESRRGIAPPISIRQLQGYRVRLLARISHSRFVTELGINEKRDRKGRHFMA